MKDKLSQGREFLLDGIESGRFPAGSKLPGARDLAAELHISFLVAQHVVSSLEQDGVIECVSRRGAYVRHGWENRLIRNHLVIFQPFREWIPGMLGFLAEELPELRFSRGFRRGMFELRTTFELQEHRDDYMDLSRFLPECIHDEGRFFSRPFRGFSEPDGRLFGIPFIFSPRVIFFNRGMLAAHRLPAPRKNWTWEEFIGLIRTLRRHYPAERVFTYFDRPYFWMNFIFRAGGKLIDRLPDGSTRVCIDSPETIRGMALLRELCTTVYGFVSRGAEVECPFHNGDIALAMADRELYSVIHHSGFDDWGTVPLPEIPGGRNVTTQATDLICVRRECADNALAGKYIRFLLGERMQQYIGQRRYGIPILKQAAQASIDSEDPRDLLFLNEMNTMSAEYNVDSPPLTEIIYGGVSDIIHSDCPLEPAAAELASALRTILKVRDEISRKKN